MADGTSGVDSPMTDHSLFERAKHLGLGSREVLRQLGIGLLESQDGEDESSVALRTAKELFEPVYRLLIREVAGVDAESLRKIETHDAGRLRHPETFIDATMSLMKLYGDELPSAAPKKGGKDGISFKGAVAVSCLLAPENQSEETVKAAQKAVLRDPHAASLLPKLQALIQAPPTK